MAEFWKDTIDHLESLHNQAQEVLAGLSQEALDWKPVEGANSLAALIVHLCGAERYWLGAVAAQETIQRDRAAEFLVEGLDAERLSARLSAATSYAWQTLWKLREANLVEERISPRDGRIASLGWVLEYTLAHTALHLGQMQMTRQIWFERDPSLRSG
jgi:uncharacterized damage-inducible protein DinB